MDIKFDLGTRWPDRIVQHLLTANVEDAEYRIAVRCRTQVHNQALEYRLREDLQA